MKIKVIIEGGFKDENDVFEFDDVRTVEDSRGEYFCRAGWAKDLSGNVPTNVPERDDVILKIDSIKKTNKAGEL